MSEQVVTEALRRWIVAQAQAGHSPESVLEAMKASGWNELVALDAMESTLLPLAAQACAGGRLPQVATESAHVIELPDRTVQVLASLELPRVVVLGGLLSDLECDQLIEAARSRLARSETVDDLTGAGEVHEARTSRGMFFQREESDLIARIERRLAALLGWPLERGEGLQVLHYGPGAQYRPHHDYFDPDSPGSAAVLRRGGQRVATVVMYLNTPQSGGATVFPEAGGLSVNAVKGHAVFFSYPLPLAATRTLHGGAPVLSGEKWVATKWLRQGRFD
jgi:prolyl 4-hydroxylase